VTADAHTYQGSRDTTFVGGTTGCAAAASTGYVNPFAHAQVTPSRIDQGVDYSGNGPINALGAGRVVLVSTTDAGWGNGPRRRWRPHSGARTATSFSPEPTSLRGPGTVS
jgi:hypothetical protein